MTLALSQLQTDHLQSLVDGQTLPLPPLDTIQIEVILGLLQKAFDEVKAKFALSVATGHERDLNGFMVDELRRLVRTDAEAQILIRDVTRGSESKNYDAQHIEERPDIQISLSSNHHLFPLIVECKLIDLPNRRQVSDYCVQGIARFTCGDYAWTNREGVMLAYVRDGSDITGCLTPHLQTAMSLTPPEFAVVNLPAKYPGFIDAALSEHGRYFTYVHSPQVGVLPGNIAIWHLWVT